MESEVLSYIVLSIAVMIISIKIASWIFRIDTIIRYLRAQLFLLKRIAEKSDALNEEQRQWVEKQLK